ncbi:ABC transporter permease [Agromyces aerolatus]|uniref:ABC transporter permease n=1 Tax=Agromyces sp. LY-1074 TaxID=3074080 RepID=UPI002866954C|nr:MULTISPECIES: ABC transporter permease [unclassified Agromyces]MDR5700454.1 ABC transporter permease [Agromyces sp. LY-1074]MDR5706975.1 ABC transporter permease [Agromyces sp. LY-1358]
MTQLVAPATRRTRSASSGSIAGFLLRRTGRLAASFVILVTVAFLMLRMIPGDPIRLALGPTAPQELVDARRAQLGLDLPIWEQYLHFWGGLLRGDLGDSFQMGLPVWEIILSRLPATLELAGIAVIITLVLSVPIGMTVAALTRGGQRRRLELGYTATSGFFAVVPEFVLGVLLIFVFAVQLQLAPVAGRSGPESYILPVIALSLGGIAALSRIVRIEALSVLDEDYLRTARAKRMSRARLYFRHALPNLLTSALTVGGLIFGGLIAGAVLVETVFAWPGLGQMIVQSIRENDYPLAQGIVIVYGSLVLLVTLAIDLILMAIDRRSTLKEH